jgi:DNA-directed RNA polymerase subunit K/omega
MKFVEIEDLLKKYPNRYMSIVAASKEARKIIEERKPAPISREETTATAETAVPEEMLSGTLEPNLPKKRGRKPKNLTISNTDAENILAQTENKGKPVDTKTAISMRGRVSAEKSEENPYIEAIKRILK